MLSTNIFFTNIYECTNINASYTLFKLWIHSQPSEWVINQPVIFFPKKTFNACKFWMCDW